jgi:hypothetical protein
MSQEMVFFISKDRIGAEIKQHALEESGYVVRIRETVNGFEVIARPRTLNEALSSKKRGRKKMSKSQPSSWDTEE